VEVVPEGYRVHGRRLKGGDVHLEAPVSSQFISALMMVGPAMENGLRITRSGKRLSEPYVRMTAAVMAQYGVQVHLGEDEIHVVPGGYTERAFSVPPDWSSASFWYQIAALSPAARVLLLGLFEDGIQGDAAARTLWQPWVITTLTEEGMLLEHRGDTGAGTTFEAALEDTPDLFQPLVLTCAGVGATATFTGLDNLPLKESDRLLETARVLARLGATAMHGNGAFKLLPWQLVPVGADIPPIDPAGDHRMAMACAPLCQLTGSIRISDPAVVEKSYPGYWDHLRMAGFGVVPAEG
jgi:3-phosphoshikimate 1-carboxyvinyltransferase